MKTIFIAIMIISVASVCSAMEWDSYTQDNYGRWENSQRTWTDQDGDGVINKYDRNNLDRNVW